jgi:hypothetical protein
MARAGSSAPASSVNERQAVSDQLKDISCTDETAKKIVERFCDHIHWLVSVPHIYQVLFEDEQPSCRTLMEKTASSFFTGLNRILHEYLLLESAKITDHATTRGDTNFTVDFIVQNIRWPNDRAVLKKMTSLPTDDKDILKELKSLQAVAEGFRKQIEPARNKLLAHSDMEIVLSGTSLGAFPEGEDRRFFAALQKLCNITHEACFGTIYGDMSTVASGDALSFTRALACAVAFDEALSESSDQNKTWLYSCLEKARHEAVRH